jgi:hypothetical protein
MRTTTSGDDFFVLAERYCALGRLLPTEDRLDLDDDGRYRRGQTDTRRDGKG